MSAIRIEIQPNVGLLKARPLINRMLLLKKVEQMLQAEFDTPMVRIQTDYDLLWPTSPID